VTEELAKRWSLSPTPLREAYQRLAAEGLVVYTAQRGVHVAPLSLAEMKDIYRLRLLLEPMALEESIAHGDDSWLDEIQHAYQRLSSWFVNGEGPDLGNRDELSRYEDDHMAFHRALVSASPSVWLLRIVLTLRAHSHRYHLLSWPQRGGVDAARREHAALFEATYRQDTAQAVAVCRTHIELTYESVLKLIGRWEEPQGDTVRNDTFAPY
jgi:GntR family carbon starvation induced transcriptional regulator